MAQTVSLFLSAEGRCGLDWIVEDLRRPVKPVQRARIVLPSVDRLPVLEIAKRVGVSRPMVWRWQQRYAEESLDGLLRDKTRPPAIPPTPQAEVHAVVELYMNPPRHAVVVSIDEKSQIQALERTRPGLLLKPGRCATMTHDYKRNGTTTLFAALSVLEGKVIGGSSASPPAPGVHPLPRHCRAVRASRQGDPRHPRRLRRPQASPRRDQLRQPAPARFVETGSTLAAIRLRRYCAIAYWITPASSTVRRRVPVPASLFASRATGLAIPLTHGAVAGWRRASHRVRIRVPQGCRRRRRHGSGRFGAIRAMAPLRVAVVHRVVRGIAVVQPE